MGPKFSGIRALMRRKVVGRLVVILSYYVRVATMRDPRVRRSYGLSIYEQIGIVR